MAAKEMVEPRRLPQAVLWGARVLTLIILVGVIALSLLPGEAMPSIGRGLSEHLLAYAALTASGALGYARDLGLVPLIALAFGLAGLAELAQLLLPQRTFSTLDLLAGLAGAGLGVMAAGVARRLLVSPRPERG